MIFFIKSVFPCFCFSFRFLLTSPSYNIQKIELLMHHVAIACVSKEIKTHCFAGDQYLLVAMKFSEGQFFKSQTLASRMLRMNDHD